MNPGAEEEAARRASNGDLASACEILQAALESTSDIDQRVRLLVPFVRHSVTLSRHADALSGATRLRALLAVPAVSKRRGQALAAVLSSSRLLRARPSEASLSALARALGAHRLRAGASVEALRALQLAYFWHDLDECRALALLQIARSRSEAELLRSVAWLGYGDAYAGNSQGIRVLRAVLARAHRIGDGELLCETYPLLAIGYHMCRKIGRSRHYHLLFQARYGKQSAFYALLSHTNLLALMVSAGDYGGLAAQIQHCFARSFALGLSRHHLQIHGAQALLLAIEGNRDEADKASAASRAAAERNDDRLDWMIYYRLAALKRVIQGDIADAAALAERGLALCAAYGNPRFYRDELEALRQIARAPDGFTPYRAALLAAISRHLATMVQDRSGTAPERRRARFSGQLAEALRIHFEFDPAHPPTTEDLRAKLSRTFETEYVLLGTHLLDIKEQVLRERGIDVSNVAVEEGSQMHFTCSDGEFFFGLQSEKTSEFRADLAVGMTIRSIDALSESLVWAALRLILSQYVFVHSLRIARDAQAKHQRAVAVGTLAPMLAHDVRRPFAMVRSVIRTLSSARDAREFRAHADALHSEIELAIESAEGLLQDIIDMSNDVLPHSPEPTAAEALIGAALLETLRGHPTCDVSLQYELRHRGAVCVDSKKVQRVFSNIIANGVQAMSYRGVISFRTESIVEDGRKFVACSIANNGPAIPEQDLPSLFDPFFTRNKPTGTGLGLAISQRIVSAHGGTISCYSSPEWNVVFRFTLPEVEVIPFVPPQLPSHSREVTPQVADFVRMSRESPPRSTEQLLELAIVDDSPAFLMGWRNALTGAATVHLFSSPEAFWAENERDPGLLGRLWAVVTDFRFANSRQTGVSFARTLKAKRADVVILMSSSGFVLRPEVEGAIDAVLDKDDLSWSALLRAFGTVRSERGASA